MDRFLYDRDLRHERVKLRRHRNFPLVKIIINISLRKIFQNTGPYFPVYGRENSRIYKNFRYNDDDKHSVIIDTALRKRTLCIYLFISSLHIYVQMLKKSKS